MYTTSSLCTTSLTPFLSISFGTVYRRVNATNVELGDVGRKLNKFD